MPADYIAFITRLHCPECGAALFSSGSEVWCSRQGSADSPGCKYGVASTVTVREHLDRVKREYVEAQIEAEIVAIRHTLTHF